MRKIVDLLKEIILDFQEVTIEPGLSRHLQLKPLPGKATICIGVRRCGKSTLMFQHMVTLLTAGTPRENIVHLNFFDDRLHALQQVGLGIILEAYYSIYPEKKHSEKIHYFFDEIQTISGWESFIERLMRTENCEVYITGSSAKLLSKEIATQMRGRALSWELFPFSFSEFLDYKQIQHRAPFSTKNRLMIQKAFEAYFTVGGFPEVLPYDASLRRKIHQEYFNTILFRDLIERYNITHPKALIDLAHWLMDNVASPYSINRLTGYLKSLGHKIQKADVANYLIWLEDAYFLFTVRIFDASLARSNANSKKIYCIDHALVSSVASGILVNSGHLLENLVFLTLRRVTSKIYYYRTNSGKEIDFVANTENRRRILIQVCESMIETSRRKREIEALTEAMMELKINKAFVITRNEKDYIEVESGKIDILPIWSILDDTDHYFEK